jgi:NAD(P)-dependent dehydrogenase (short-subunit alcohol dehydrogenase family)
MSARNGHDGCALVTGGTRGIGATIALAAFGAGFVWGAGIVSWKERVHVCA